MQKKALNFFLHLIYYGTSAAKRTQTEKTGLGDLMFLC